MSKQVSWAGKKWFASYKAQNRYARNKQRKLERHMKRFPNDTKTAKVLEDGLKSGFAYKRKTPITPIWSKSDKKLLELMHSVDGITGKEYLTKRRDQLRVHRRDVSE